MDDLFSHITGDNDPAMDRPLGGSTKPKKKKRKVVADPAPESMDVDGGPPTSTAQEPEEETSADGPLAKKQKFDTAETVEVDAVEVQAQREVAVSNGLTGQETSDQGASLVLTHQVC